MPKTSATKRVATPRAKAAAAGDVLSTRALNRALLARQWLLQRESRTVAEALTQLVGLQAQAPDPPYIGLWTRLTAFEPAALADLILQRQAVRISLMRATLHLVMASEAAALRALTQPALDRGLEAQLLKFGGSAPRDALGAAAAALVEVRPMTAVDMGAALREQWPAADPRVLSNAARSIVPMVQVPPRGVWGSTGPAAFTTLSHWIDGRQATTTRPKTRKAPDAPNAPDALRVVKSPKALSVSKALTLDELLWRYFGAFGPASMADARTWSGLAGLDEVMARLRPRLRVFRDEQGRELFDQPEAPRPDPETPAPVRFLPEFDNLLLSHADRTRVMTLAHRARVAVTGGMIPATILVDGFLQGTWRIERPRTRASGAILRITPFARLRTADRQALTEEGARLLRFVAPAAPSHDIRIEPPV